MAGIGLEVGNIDGILDELMQRAEESVADTLMETGRVLGEYVIAYSPQWSGDMVAQWTFAVGAEAVAYQQTAFKENPWRKYIEGAMEPYHPASNPNRAAMTMAANRMNTALDKMAGMPAAELISTGFSLVNPHAQASVAMGVRATDSKLGVAARDPRAVPVLDAALNFAYAKLALVSEGTGQKSALARRKRVNPFQLARNSAAAGRTFNQKDSKLARRLRSDALAERDKHIRELQASVGRVSRRIQREKEHEMEEGRPSRSASRQMRLTPEERKFLNTGKGRDTRKLMASIDAKRKSWDDVQTQSRRGYQKQLVAARQRSYGISRTRESVRDAYGSEFGSRRRRK